MSLLLPFAFYGDDFTGSTDALEFLSRSGVKTVLFIDPPTAAQIEQFDGIQAVGVAGLTRSMNPADMEVVLQKDFRQLKSLGFQLVHYKVCSTFDSSPTIGSIGKAIEVGLDVFDGSYVPVVAGAPHLGRYCVFGNLFARMGIGSNADIFRLDRHPSMMNHPVTPATESDLCVHLGAQTDQEIKLLDVLDLRSSDRGLRVRQKIDEGCKILVMDGLEHSDMTSIGELIAPQQDDNQSFIAGSSGVELALGLYWSKQGDYTPVDSWPQPAHVDPLLVISGSCSPVTARQIESALSVGFEEVAVATESLVSGRESRDAEIERCVSEAIRFIQSGKDVIVHTAKGKTDPRFEKTRKILLKSGLPSADIEGVTGECFGKALGAIAAACLKRFSIQRLVIAGGDSSSFAARVLGIEAVEMICPMVPGAPLCRVLASSSGLNGMEVNFKGGQVGKESYFIEMKKGCVSGST